MSGVTVKVDFRRFINFLKQTERGAYASTQDPELRRLIYLDIANSGLIHEKGEDTGATAAAVDAVQRGDTVHNEVHTNSKGVKRFANATISDKGIFIDPVDEKGRSYGEYSVVNNVSEYQMGTDMNRYTMIIRILKRHGEKGE